MCVCVCARGTGPNEPERGGCVRDVEIEILCALPKSLPVQHKHRIHELIVSVQCERVLYALDVQNNNDILCRSLVPQYVVPH